jgi:hypothetical protein
MAITVNKTIPSSDFYTDTGSVTISLAGVNSITVNSKKNLLKIQIPQSKSSQDSSPSDVGTNYVKDLKKIEDNIKIRGWLVDQTDSSAWQQAWQLRAMSSRGGPVNTLIIENLTFDTSSQQAFLEEVNFIAHPARTLGLRIDETSSASVGVNRIEVDLSFYLGDER